MAQDAGGLMREWLTELTKALFSVETGLFVSKRNSNNEIVYYPSPSAKIIYN